MGPIYSAYWHNKISSWLGESLTGLTLCMLTMTSLFHYEAISDYTIYRLYYIHQHILYLMNIDHWFSYQVIPSLVPYLKESYHLKIIPHSTEGNFLKHLYRLQKT